MKNPIWMTVAPPTRWLLTDQVSDRQFWKMWGQFILTKLILYLLAYWVIMFLPAYVDPEWPYSWTHYLGVYLVLGGFIGFGVLDKLPYHHMMSLNDLARMKVKAWILWPLWYAKTALVFLVQ